MFLTEEERAYLATQHLGRLATLQPDGTLQASPVGFRINNALETIDIGGRNMAASKKFRNLRVNHQVALVIDDIASTDPWRVRGVEIRGTADAIDDATDSAVEFSGPIIRIHPLRIISWGINVAQAGMAGRNVVASSPDR